MPFYYGIDGRTEPGRQIASGLLRLKDGLDMVGLPKRTVTDTLMLATWNIREFGDSKYGIRSSEPIYYIAEIIDRFDLVAVQEVGENLTPLNQLARVLGGWWKVVLTDVTEGRPGNRERMAFLYDSRKLSFGGLAGEIVLPPTGKEGGGYLAADQLARTPYIVGFRAGWFRFTICTTHILYGKAVAETPERTREIRELARFLAARVTEPHAWARNMIVLGDFNIFRPADVTFQAITDAGFVIPEQLRTLPSNVERNKHYDQIGFLAPDVQDGLELCRAGIFNYYDHVYRVDDEERYHGAMGPAYEKDKDGSVRDAKARSRYYKLWRTFQMSDHLPMWIELKIDFSKEYLQKKLDVGLGPREDVGPGPGIDG
jgi:hypothetical protein